MSTSATAIRFPCAGCGGPMIFDSDSQHMKCQYCDAEQEIDNVLSQPVEHPFHGSIDTPAELLDWGTEQKTIHCESCGGETLIPVGQTTVTCIFCNSPKVLEQDQMQTIRPETLIPFQISSDKALRSFAAWKKKRWFLPNKFKRMNVSSQLHSIYIPYWTYDTESYSVYRAERGVYHYRTVPRTRVVNGKSETVMVQERYTVWNWVNGEYDRAFDDILIPASGHYNQNMLERLGDFDLRNLVPYKPDYLSGYVSERYSVSREQGWDKAQSKADDQLRDEIRRRIGGDEVRNLRVRTNYNDVTYKHLLLPVWNANYTYKTKQYYYMVNGQTGTVSGHVPRSPLKITLFTLFCLAVAGVLLWFYLNQQQPM
ncbi:MAG: hypothetical protein P0Y55_15020 [Candidatus Cohnella colombiensis]|uniref:TFIIB-type zinc ribbon-containing protein n=1 Tax=Candidatus Cohnella colombiensis TaxID=3121368 RepID=A0AA95JF37_9BACL|nr:MAG: hypothetical protein P0Y55_15020 [Cohnella sp.]